MPLIAENQTVSTDASTGVDPQHAVCFMRRISGILSMQVRIDRAYDMGEPIAMICDELQLRYAHRPRMEKTPLEMATRVVRFNGSH